MLARLLRPISDVPLAVESSIIAAYARQVSHDVYRRPSIAPIKVENTEHKKLLDKVGKMTVPDDQMPTPPPKKGRRRR